MEQYRIALNKLDDIAKGQDIRLRHLENGYHLKSSCFDWVIPFFEERLKRRLKNTYDVRTRLRILSLFLSFIETQNAKKLEDISINHIAAAFEASTDQNHFRSTIREFLSFAAENGWMPTNLSCFVPKIRRHRGVPTVYSTDDIETCLASIDRTTQSGKRTYAVLLICARLGLRNTDACELKFSDIDWVKKTISIVQMKTGIPLVLPLLPEIEDAINRYIAARPQSDLSFIFCVIKLRTALILYLIHEAPPEEQNFEMLIYMIENGGAKEDDDDYQSPLDLLFEALEEDDPSHIAVREYKIYKQAAGKTAKSILISAAVRLSAFILPEIQNITAKDDMELDKMGERKQAVFAIIPDNDSTFNYIVGMLYTCAFQSLYYQADKVHQGALPVPVRMMMDEFCNVSLPDDFGKLQATMRSRNIMSTIVLQNISALKALFKDDWEGLIGNADTLLYLGGNEVSTFKYISELLGKETLDTRTRSVSKGRNGSGSVNYQQTGRELMTPDEVRALDNDRCILFIRGELPVMDRKYDILKHPDLKLTEDGGAAPYVHCPGLDYALEDFPLSTERWESIEIIE